MRRARLPWTVATGALLAVLAISPAGAFQLRSCVSGAGAGPCTQAGDHFAVTQPSALAISPDGRSLYDAAANAFAIGQFGRDASNAALGYVGCIGAMSFDLGCAKGPSDDAFDQIEALILSPDGSQLYAAAYNGDTITLLNRDSTTGGLTFAGCQTAGSDAGCTKISGSALDGPIALVMSPDGNFLYSAAGFGNSVAVFQRENTGALTYRGCIGASTSTCTPVSDAAAMNEPSALAISPDGKFLYSTAFTGDAIAVFSRNGAGALAYTGCIGSLATTCATTVASSTALQGPSSLLISSDGKQLYSSASSGDAIAIFDRDAATGALAYRGCIGATSEGSCTAISNVNALDGPGSLRLSADGTRLFSAAFIGNAISTFRRDPATGALQFERCLSESGAGPCMNANNAAALHGPTGLALSPDGLELHVAAREADAIATIGMEPARCQAVAVSTPEGTALQVPLGCVDPDGGDALSYVLGKPAHGQLGAVDDATGAVLYAPDPGFAGADGFDVTATDYEGTASTRVTIQVRGGVPAADTTAPVLSASFSHKRFRVGARATAFSARRAPTGTTLRWRLSEAATVRVAFSRTGAGRRVGARCVKPTQRNSSRSHCRRRIGEGVLTRRGATGAGRLVFSGRIGRHALRRGAHRATVTATDQAGNRSKPVQLAFRIVRR